MTMTNQQNTGQPGNSGNISGKKLTDGAEARITVKADAIIKERRPKKYRHPVLDERLRTDRTKQEARLLKKAYQAGVRVPTVQNSSDITLELERIAGDTVKHVLNGHEILSDEHAALAQKIGESIARLHNKDLVHGDLTTSNMIVSNDADAEDDGDVYFIDFGLGRFSQRIEDRAVDLHLFKEVLESTHTAVADAFMEHVLDAYESRYDKAAEVLERYAEIAERGRYR